MRVILDTNILISALIVPHGAPSYLYQCWRRNRFALVSSEEQLDEFRRVTRYPRLERFLNPALAGTMVNEVRALAVLTGPLPRVEVSPDPADNFLSPWRWPGKPTCWLRATASTCSAWSGTGPPASSRHGKRRSP